MTILGDIAQGIYGHRGISNWDQVKPIFDNEKLEYEEIMQNYRSTQEIVLLANEVLKNIARDRAVLAQPISRSGTTLKIVQASSQADMFSAVASEIKSFLCQDISHIAVIVKNSQDCDEATTS